MEFKNLDCNILYVLGEAWSRSGALGPFDVQIISIEFSDIPDEDITAELMALYEDGLVLLHDGGQKLSLTSRGVAKIKSLQPEAT